MRASLSVNPRKTVLHVSGFYENREDHQPNRVKPMVNSGSHSEMATSSENSSSPPSGEKADMETSSVAVNVINVEVPLATSRSRIDIEMTTDTLEKADPSSPQAGFHHPNVRDVSTMGSGSLLTVTESPPKILNQISGPKITSTYAEGDPFLAKLQEIDRDLQKFDPGVCEKKECSVNKLSAQLFQDEASQKGKMDSLGPTIVKQKKGLEHELNKAQNGPKEDGKMEIGPGPQKDFKKGQWTRINRPYHDTREEASYGIDSLKRKGRENQVREELKTEKGKKTKPKGR